jgi:hypothetical protein
MKLLVAIAALAASFAVQAQTVTPGCQITWDYETPLPASVEGFRLFVNGTPTWEGEENLISCADAIVVEEGDYSVNVRAFNVLGESEASNTINFTLVTSVPSAPSVLRITN